MVCKILIAALIVGVGLSAIAQWYGPNNPRPTQHDVWEAERNAQNHMQRSVEVSGWETIREQERANQARQDADSMRMRMWDNERRENAKREEESRRWNEVNRWGNGNHGMIVVPGTSASMLKHINKKRVQRQNRQKDVIYPNDVMNADLNAPLYMDAELRAMQREQAEIDNQRATWKRRDEILRRGKRSR